ncbi:hypothetical protein AURDEDRAFT_173474 [Auricularia subglabra TFB-10046 SS5]|nr:hypothetical protein AURDEDRAFT_173474 [Auricularia subglabra TFB-10046 SS5]
MRFSPAQCLSPHNVPCILLFSVQWLSYIGPVQVALFKYRPLSSHPGLLCPLGHPVQ